MKIITTKVLITTDQIIDLTLLCTRKNSLNVLLFILSSHPNVVIDLREESENIQQHPTSVKPEWGLLQSSYVHRLGSLQVRCDLEHWTNRSRRTNHLEYSALLKHIQ